MMANRKGIHISGHYIVSINDTRYQVCLFMYMYFEL